ncbi:MAG: glycoside hydrolase family 1 [Opitutaceae bacterium]|nr:glycoside hydrolase family 1 [Opitutaceae bacterium]
MSPPRTRKISTAWLETPTQGRVELAHDWRARYNPPLVLVGDGAPKWASVSRVADYVFGCESGYFVNRKEEIYFFLRVGDFPEAASSKNVSLYLAGDFNSWAEAIGDPHWEMVRATLAGEAVYIWRGESRRFFADPPVRFKFVTGDAHWLEVPLQAPNAAHDGSGNLNRLVDPDRTGQHLFQFTLEHPLDLSKVWRVGWADEQAESQQVPLMPGAFFFQTQSALPLGVTVEAETSVFRLFAPRAKFVQLCVCDSLAQKDQPMRYDLHQGGDGIWELTLDQDLHGWYYWYNVDGPRDAFGHFDPNHRILDPYAMATVSRDGPGIVLSREWIGKADRGRFRTPAWQDLVIAEAHVRDLVELAPGDGARAHPPGFSELAGWVRSPGFYLDRLGVNCVELQPVQAADAKTHAEYHWGYMTVNFFAPAFGYSTSPETASGVRELQDLIAAFHERGMAVLLDVVFNHVGEPAHLLYVDKLYYFDQNYDGHLANWSGCGNDVRPESAMVRRLVIDSCVHLIQAYGVDGFRFDLAELLGIPLLREVEAALKAVKPDVILIAEPWSYRGHIAAQLRDTGWASWNDGYRDFIREFVRGGGSRGSYEYFLKGSPWHFAHWPAQTVNYTESHDDRVWIDVITENSGFDGSQPTANDRRRTHLMIAVLMMSVGIPMVSQGQDFLRSKRGLTNTYLRGDINALDYRQAWRFSGTHGYFAAWVAFRRGKRGRLLRHFSRVSEGFFQFWFARDSLAAATVYNADFSQGSTRLLFAVNPTAADVSIELGESVLAGAPWSALADTESFHDGDQRCMTQPLERNLFVPALGCGLWVSE